MISFRFHSILDYACAAAPLTLRYYSGVEYRLMLLNEPLDVHRCSNRLGGSPRLFGRRARVPIELASCVSEANAARWRNSIGGNVSGLDGPAGGYPP